MLCVDIGLCSTPYPLPPVFTRVFLQVWRGFSSGASALVPVVGLEQPHSAPGLPLLSGPSAHISLPPALTLHEVRDTHTQSPVFVLESIFLSFNVSLADH